MGVNGISCNLLEILWDFMQFTGHFMGFHRILMGFNGIS